MGRKGSYFFKSFGDPQEGGAASSQEPGIRTYGVAGLFRVPVGKSPLSEERVRGDPRRPGGLPPHVAAPFRDWEKYTALTARATT